MDSHTLMYNTILQELSSAVVSQWRKDEMRIRLKSLKKTVDDSDKANKAKLVEKVVLFLQYFSYSYVNFTGC